MKLNYYARLNSQNICIEVVSTAKNLKGVSGYVSIPDYNESLIYRKYLPNGSWSGERYEPEIDVIVQERLEQIEDANVELQSDIGGLNKNINMLEGTIMELMTLLAEMGGM